MQANHYAGDATSLSLSLSHTHTCACTLLSVLKIYLYITVMFRMLCYWLVFSLTQILFLAVGWFIGLLTQSKLMWIICFPFGAWNYKWGSHLYMYLFTYSINEMENSSPYVNVCFGNNLEHQSKPKATLEFVMTGVDFT